MRLFIAFEIPFHTLKTLNTAAKTLLGKNQNIRWVQASNQHLTLAFLGDINNRCICEIKKIMNAASLKNSKIKAGLDNELRFFTSDKRPSVLWVGFKSGRKKIESMADHLKNGLSEGGYMIEKRKYIPHLTLGRVKPGARNEPLCHSQIIVGLQNREIELQEIALFSSTLGSKAPFYTKLHTVTLKNL